MAHWVLVPEAFHIKNTELKKGATKAHDQCAKLEKKPKVLVHKLEPEA